MAHRNKFEEAAKLALAGDPMTSTLWDRVRRGMEREGLDPDNAYQAFMTGRYVGEKLERGECRTLTPKQEQWLLKMSPAFRKSKGYSNGT